MGAACPDHLVHTKRQPLFVDWKPDQGIDALLEQLETGVTDFVTNYQRYFDECSQLGDQLRDPAPRGILIPGVGMINTGADANTANVSRQLYHRTIAVAEGSTALSQFVSLTAQEPLTWNIGRWNSISEA